MRMKYTNEDIEFLKKYYPIGDQDTIFKRFPNLDREKIYIVSFNTIVKNFISEYNIELKDNFEDYTTDELSELSKLFLIYHEKYPLGVCIEKNLHMQFHRIYGDINNEEQWNDFVQKFNERKILH